MSRQDKITDEEIINDIENVKKILGYLPSQNDYKKYGNYALTTVLNRKPWNSWLMDKFGAAHSVPVGGNGLKVSDEELLDNLKQLQVLLGRAPKQDELELGKYSRNSYTRAFGSFSNALKKINLISCRRYDLTEKEILDDLYRVYVELGRPPTFKEFREMNQTNGSVTLTHRFGSFTKALELANIPFKKDRNFSKQDIIDALKIWFNKNNRDINCLEYWKIRKAGDRKEFPYSCNTIKKKFGGIDWEKIMWECGYVDYKTKDTFVSQQCFVGSDSQKYLSSIEKESADILYKMKQDKLIKNYSYEENVCSDKKWTCDFVITLNSDKKLWLEIDGLRNNRKEPYKSGHNEKIEFYKNNGFDFEILSYNNRDLGNSIIAMIEKRSA